MKSKGRHREKALTALQVKQVKAAGRYSDGNGLYLVVDPSGARRWLLRIMVQGRRRDIGLGGASLVPLAEAREKALAYRKVAREGGDPLEARRAAAQTIPTFKVAAEMVHAEHEISWKNPKHAKQWIVTLQTYAFPFFGERRIDSIDTPMVLQALAPIWLTKPETARRVRQRIGTVLDWAKAAGFRSGDNPVEGVSRGLPKQTDKEKHHSALPFQEVKGFVGRLHTTSSTELAKLAFEFLILTATRTSEALLAEWSEIDLAEKVWSVPAVRMKAGRVHRVPLSGRAMDILASAKLLSSDSPFVFPGRSAHKPMSNMVFLEILKRMEIKVTAHGFRSSFRDWAAETTGHPREVVEMALAHTIDNKVEAAYRRGDLLDKRRALMDEWSQFVSDGTGPKADVKEKE